MTINTSSLARVSSTLSASMLTQSLTKTQQDILNVQNQIETGNKISTPGEDPAAAAAIMQLQKGIEARTTYLGNVSSVTSQLSQVDAPLSSITDLVTQAKSIASQNVGSDVTAQQRSDAATVMQSIYSQLLSQANTQVNGVYLFGGNSGTSPFSESLGGVQYNGSSAAVNAAVDKGQTVSLTPSASSVFGNVTGKFAGTATLTPTVTASTKLSDLAGAAGVGVTPGPIKISDGATTTTVDLTGADTVGDVITRINAAGIGGITASIDVSGTGIDLNTTAGDDITVTGSSAADLGILTPTSTGAGLPVIGANLAPKLSDLTVLSTLNGGGGLDLSGGLTISNGGSSTTVDFTGATTVQDVLNKINGTQLGISAQINSAGNGIDIYNLVQGTNLSVGENGGNAATSLGIRTMSGQTTLASLNGGKGVGTVTGNDLRISLSDGTNVDLDLDSMSTIDDLLNAINGSGAAITASLATTGNGIVLTDNSGGPGLLNVGSLNGSTAPADLGLDTPSVSGSFQGKDVSPVQANGLFSHINQLRDALANNDQAGITAAAAALDADGSRVVTARGANGALLQELDARQTHLEDQNTAATTALSNLQGVDMATAITQFQSLQTALQASLQAAGKTMNMSLLDFLS